MGYRATKSKVKSKTIKAKSLSSTDTSYVDFFYYAFRNILLVSLPLIIVFAFVLSSLSYSSAEANNDFGSSNIDNFSVSISSSCTISSVVDSSHTIEVNSGTYHSDVGKTTVTTLCNDGNGYTVYANGYSNNEEGNNRLVNAVGSQYSIATGLATSGLTSAWAMKLNNIPDDPSPTPPTVESDYNNTYGLVPAQLTKVASRSSGTTDMESGSSFTTTYSIYASSAQHAGTYEGQVKYVLVHPYISKPTINSLEMAFISHDKHVAYQDQDGSYYAMQDMTSDICNSVTTTGESTTTKLVDLRDNKLYLVTKLADNRCWMTQNLDLDINGANTMALNSDNTDISTTASGSGIYNTAGGYSVDNSEVWTWTPANTATTSGRTIDYNNNSVSGWANSDAAPYSAEAGDVYYYTSNTSMDDTRLNSLSTCKIAGHTETECAHYHAGNYYNWSAAIATNNSGGFDSSVASNSICPKGWRLPNASTVDNEYNEFGRLLYNGYGIIQRSTGEASYQDNGFVKIRSAPLFLVRSGNISGNTIYSIGASCYYWSGATGSNSSSAYNLRFDTSTVWPAANYGRSGGRSVRCVAR